MKASGLFLLAFCIYAPLEGQTIKPLKGVNTAYDEHHPVLAPNGDLFFSVGFHPENSGGPTDYGDVWMSSRDKKGDWSKPQRVPSLSTSGNDVVVGFPDPISILVYHEGNGRPQGIHQYSKFGSEWNYLRPLNMGNFRNNSKHFGGRLSQDGKTLILSINSFGTFGNEDLYVSFLISEGKWSSPLNLGEVVNSFGQEQTPYLSEDQKILYFSSNTSGKNRGKDIFYSERLDDSWTNWTDPKPLKFANSMGTEMSYMLLDATDSMAVFSTTQNSEGFGDLMTVKFEAIIPSNLLAQNPEDKTDEEENIQLSNLSEVEEALSETMEQQEDLLVVIEEQSLENEVDTLLEKVESISKPGDEIGIIRVLDAASMEEIPHKITLIGERGNRMDLEDQQDLAEALESNQWSSIFVSSKGFIPKELAPETWENLEDQVLLMQPAAAGASIVLNSIQFNRGTADFADAVSIQVLDQLVTFLKENESLKIRLEGHTDNAGDPVLNKDLSLKRASKIRGYLTLNGVEFERIRISGWGGTRPIADNSTEEGRIQNRRVEMMIEG
ncbi:outer membrane protein, OmpA/MotB family [Indibacter alkaliphilus LW1]|uniref:Outer membrane protein, OmpA/MotB family n=1 Tax=Indibacter alkaliphilus (strain CCUG 57479 / KCTC 22604 / LW1) TaxID=1189612 RepID=S2DI52_INDAL|nr:outer membrane protein, OmpA/MotB family [Indibacter alkaliphilus LW1]